jgi:hypothetical protein
MFKTGPSLEPSTHRLGQGKDGSHSGLRPMPRHAEYTQVSSGSVDNHQIGVISAVIFVVVSAGEDGCHHWETALRSNLPGHARKR